MNSLVLLVAVCFAVICSVAGHHEFKCLGKTLIFTDAQKADLKTCGEEWKKRHPNADSNSHPWAEACFMACKMTKNHWVKDGKFDVEATKKGFIAMVHDVPSTVQDQIKKDLDACASENTGTLSTDDNCKSYESIGKCTRATLWKNCKDKED